MTIGFHHAATTSAIWTDWLEHGVCHAISMGAQTNSRRRSTPELRGVGRRGTQMSTPCDTVDTTT